MEALAAAHDAEVQIGGREGLALGPDQRARRVGQQPGAVQREGGVDHRGFLKRELIGASWTGLPEPALYP
jgi:hypothetical protein